MGLPLTLAVALAVSSTSPGATTAPSNLDRYFAKLEQLVHEESEIPLAKDGSDEFSQQVHRSQNLTEAGKYALLRGLLQKRGDREGERLVLEAIASA